MSIDLAILSFGFVFAKAFRGPVSEGALAARTRSSGVARFPEIRHASLGLLRELNPGPLAPEARIIPLDQAAR